MCWRKLWLQLLEYSILCSWSGSNWSKTFVCCRVKSMVWLISHLKEWIWISICKLEQIFRSEFNVSIDIRISEFEHASLNSISRTKFRNSARQIQPSKLYRSDSILGLLPSPNKNRSCVISSLLQENTSKGKSYTPSSTHLSDIRGFHWDRSEV